MWIRENVIDEAVSRLMEKDMLLFSSVRFTSKAIIIFTSDTGLEMNPIQLRSNKL